MFADKKDVTEENIQARIRAILLMAVSNKFGCIVLNTSNKSEAAVGYGTLYGDMAGGLSVIGDVYKTDIYLLAKYINRNREIIPENSIIKPPSAEVTGPGSRIATHYLITGCLTVYYTSILNCSDLCQKLPIEGSDRSILERVIGLINNNEYKRFQAPPILRISSKAFGAGRRHATCRKILTAI